MVDLRENKNLTGLEKLQRIFASSLQSEKHIELFAASPRLLENPRLLAIQLKSIIEDIVPSYVQPVIEEGVRDGSIRTKYPKELAQVMIILSNIWLNPLVYPMQKEEVSTKIAFFNEMLLSMGIPLINEQLEIRLEQLRLIVDDK